jgi:methylase of polypeptide subunit release factors
LPDYDPTTYGDRIADVYDEWFAVPSDTEDTVGFLSDLAGSGPVLELGIGTGRVALPLAQREVTKCVVWMLPRPWWRNCGPRLGARTYP